MNKLLYILCLILGTALSAEHKFPFLDDSRFSLDFSSRLSYNDRSEEFTLQQFIGFDFHKYVSFDNKDFGYLVVQPYLNRIDNGNPAPSFYDDAHDWEFIFRTLTFTYYGLGPDKPWLRLGHFELPFGLDHRKDTNGSLHQYSLAKATGMKIDWGVAVGQEFESWYYELALTRGSGVKYRDRENPYAYMGRIAHDHDTWSIGLSFFKGEVLKGKNTVEVETVALDFEWYYKSYGLLTEVYYSDQNNKRINGGLLELNWTSFEQDAGIYAQFHLRNHEVSSTESSLIFGGEYDLNENLSISAQVNFSLESAANKDRHNIFDFQLRYKF